MWCFLCWLMEVVSLFVSLFGLSKFFNASLWYLWVYMPCYVFEFFPARVKLGCCLFCLAIAGPVWPYNTKKA